MKCEEFLAHLPSYPDGIQDMRLLGELRKHAAECPICEARLSQQETMLAALGVLDDTLEVPDAFAKGWRGAVRQEGNSAPHVRRWQGWALAAVAVLTLFAGTSLMRSGILFPENTQTQEMAYGYADYDMAAPYVMQLDEGYAPAAEGEAMLFKAAASTGMGFSEPAARERVILHTASVTIQTERYDEDMRRLEALLQENGGWTEYQSVYGEPFSQPEATGRTASMTLRVPMNALDRFLSGANEIGRVTGSEKTAQDISESYYDTKARLEMYQTQRARLMELLSRAESMADIIEIEARTSEIQYTIESLQSTLNSWNSRAESAVVTIYVTEVGPGETRTSVTFPERLAAAVGDSLRQAWVFLQDMVMFLVMAAPYLAAMVVVLIFGILLQRRRKKNDRR